MNPTFPAFIFDLDGTLVKFSAGYSHRYANIIRDVFRSYEIEPDEEFIKRIELYGDFEAIIDLIGDRWAEYFWFRVEAADFALRKELMAAGEITIMPGALEVLGMLLEILPPNRPLSLLSNTHPPSAFWEMWQFNLLPYFKRIYLLNWNFSVAKPDPSALIDCIGEYDQICSFPVVYVGDSAGDAEMIHRACGLHPELPVTLVQVSPAGVCPYREDISCHLIEDLRMLPDVARQIISQS
ncbi:MAG TPA: HAD family hydrolase [Candidatus Lokiarchaeia archaeon]|nr:HAD family hydrolase [Candidatus Lokiarchaeia archaeon]